MSLFKKKKEVKPEAYYQLPELPELPELPKLPPLSKFPQSTALPELPASLETREIKSLPSFSGELDSDFSEAMVKSAVSPPIQSQKTGRRTLEIPETKFIEKMPKPRLEPLPLLPASSIPKLSKKIEPVYIRIDKFNAAIQSFNEIQNKIQEIENLLKEIRETKQKEDAELREWERDLETVKARIDAIDKNIFSKLD